MCSANSAGWWLRWTQSTIRQSGGHTLSGQWSKLLWRGWLYNILFRPFVSHCLKVFGSRRVMFGSDWPVCKLAGAEHGQVFIIVQSLNKHFEKTNFASRWSNYWKASLNYAMLIKQNLNTYSKRMHFLYTNFNFNIELQFYWYLNKLDSWTYLVLGKVILPLAELYRMNIQFFSLHHQRSHRFEYLNIFLDSRWFSTFLEVRLTHNIPPRIEFSINVDFYW